ncbi:hypothetical protein GDO86_014969 [Hymenochirus boettgeri]|uniref:Toll-like receptor 4 n=1 Tax=Hymenochirus boettgeri TaxID=247094 RepID=A0A8T2JQZ9_9PIPI|nr:hypothetical protein GDO86_014969 [Hymenochirus boettgeri]
MPKSTQKLDLSFNPLRRIHANYFSHLPNIRYLDLTRCRITVVEDMAFLGLEKLQTLIFTGNPISYWAPLSFFGLQSLHKLVVVETSLLSLSDLPIENITSLRELYGGHNLLKTLHLSRSLVLETLNLRDNHISEINDSDLDCFRTANTSSLSLILSRNPINYISPKAFRNISLHKLQLQGCFKDADFLRSNLKALSGSLIAKLEIGYYRPTDTPITFQENLLEGLCEAPIQKLTVNGMIFQTTDTLFDCVEGITFLRIVNTDLELDKVIVHQTFYSLQHLHVQKKIRITGIRKLTSFNTKLQNLNKLKVLDLSNNKLNMQSCCLQIISGAKNLQHLNLSFNSYIRLSTSFLEMPYLLTLDLSHSQIDTVGQFPIFKLLGNLILLDLSHTNCHFRIHYTFFGLNRLEELKVPGNVFDGDILGTVFQNLSRLHSVDLSSCSIDHIPLGTFSGLTMLKSINLSKNKLLELNPSILSSLDTMTYLDLSYNLFEAFPEDSMHALTRTLTELFLLGNPFDCSCKHYHFLLWFNQQKDGILQERDKILCTVPDSLKGTSLTNVSINCRIDQIITPIVLVILFSITVCLVFYYLCHTHTGRFILKRCKKPSSNTEKEYDGFVIYSSEDDEWVTKQLVPILEGEKKFKLCLHCRDFLPGIPIITNIVNEGLLKSRNALVVLSNNFLQSKWCIYEFEMAKTWQWFEHDAELIVIVLESINKADLRKIVGIHRYLSRNTYLEWKPGRIEQSIFWTRMHKALFKEGYRTKHQLRVSSVSTRLQYDPTSSANTRVHSAQFERT